MTPWSSSPFMCVTEQQLCRARAIGVSNFEILHLQELQQHCEIVPMINQVC